MLLWHANSLQQASSAKPCPSITNIVSYNKAFKSIIFNSALLWQELPIESFQAEFWPTMVIPTGIGQNQ